MVYKPSFLHFFTIFNEKCQFLLQKYLRKHLKSNKTLLRPNVQGNQNSLHTSAIVCLLNVHIRARFQCVAGSKSKIQIILSAFYHALNLLYLDRHLLGSTQARESCHHLGSGSSVNSDRAMSIGQYDISHQVATRYTLYIQSFHTYCTEPRCNYKKDLTPFQGDLHITLAKCYL